MDQVAGGFNIGTVDHSTSPAKWNRVARVGAEIAEAGTSEAEWEANARYIAATWNAADEAGLSAKALEARVVKELLEACEGLLDIIEGESGAGTNYWDSDARYLLAQAAIAKAKPE